MWREEKENGRKKDVCLVIDSSLGNRKELRAQSANVKTLCLLFQCY